MSSQIVAGRFVEFLKGPTGSGSESKSGGFPCTRQEGQLFSAFDRSQTSLKLFTI
jgi:hypothetical protein